MKNFFKNAWEDPVWSKVIAAVIIALGGMLITAIYDYNVLRVDSEGVRKQIVMDARNAYPQYKNLIGELFV